MTALLNIWRDLAYQFAIRGALGQRLGLVLRYYCRYAAGRRRGLSQGESRMDALLSLGAEGLTSKTVRVRSAQGKELELDLFSAAFLLKEIEDERCYEKLEAFLPRPGETVIDVGGHQGIFTVYAAVRVGAGGRVLTVEPYPPSFALLERNLKHNGLANVTLIAGAASDYDGQAVLHTTNSVSGGQSLVFDTPDRVALNVPVKTLDRLLAEAGLKPDLIKIDVEGSCLNVLKGAPNTLASRPRLVMEVELGPAAVQEVVGYLEARGYRARVFDSLVYAQAA